METKCFMAILGVCLFYSQTSVADHALDSPARPRLENAAPAQKLPMEGPAQRPDIEINRRLGGKAKVTSLQKIEILKKTVGHNPTLLLQVTGTLEGPCAGSQPQYSATLEPTAIQTPYGNIGSSIGILNSYALEVYYTANLIGGALDTSAAGGMVVANTCSQTFSARVMIRLRDRHPDGAAKKVSVTELVAVHPQSNHLQFETSTFTISYDHEAQKWGEPRVRIHP